jgi:hypothetical protein
MCRMLAETFMVPVFRKVLRLLVAYQDVAKEIQVAGKWVAMTPKAWNADVKARAVVGLGHSNRDELMIGVQSVAAFQMQAREIGLASPKHLYKTGEKLIEAVGWRDADKFFVNPETPEGQAELAEHAQSAGQDPRMVEVQSKAQLAQAQMQAKDAADRIKIEQRNREIEMKAQMAAFAAQLKANSDAQIKQFQTMVEAQLTRDQQEAEERIAIYEANLDADVRDREARSNIKEVRFGGRVG